MRKYEEMIAEFSAFGLAGREKWISKLPLEELKVFRTGLNNGPAYGCDMIWKKRLDEEIFNRICEIREERLKELGI